MDMDGAYKERNFCVLTALRAAHLYILTIW